MIDFCVVNDNVCHTRDVELVDLKSTYLQIHVDHELWKYQLVSYKGKCYMYCLTRLDSAAVNGWIASTMNDRLVKISGGAEILVKRRLGLLTSLVDDLGLNVNVSCVASAQNKADVLTREKKE